MTHYYSPQLQPHKELVSNIQRGHKNHDKKRQFKFFLLYGALAYLMEGNFEVYPYPYEARNVLKPPKNKPTDASLF